MHEYSLEEALNWLIDEYGIAILSNRQKAYALLTDKITGDIRLKERMCLKSAFTSGVVDLLIKASKNDFEASKLIDNAADLLNRNTDISTEIADEVIESFVKVLKIEKQLDQIIYTPVKSSKKGRLKKVFLSIVVLIGLYYLFINPSTTLWVIGCGSATLCVIISYFLAVFIEDVIYNEKCQTYTVCIVIFAVVNLFTKYIVGSDYQLIFNIYNGFVIGASLLNIWYCFEQLEDRWFVWNVLFVILYIVLLFGTSIKLSANITQWMIGIGGGLTILFLVYVFSKFLDAFLWDFYNVMSVILTLWTIANFVFYVFFHTQYSIISICFMGCIALGSVLNIKRAAFDLEFTIVIFNVILMCINIAAIVLIQSNPKIITDIINFIFVFFKTLQK